MDRHAELFSILDTTESSNNYAAAKIHAGMATSGEAWLALEQTSGKGQRGKSWVSAKGENILMSVVIKPGKALQQKPFFLSFITANVCRQFFSKYCSEIIQIKWPNDIYWGDRKTGGILIENIYRGSKLAWSVIGIGMNINQTSFGENDGKPASLKMITGETYHIPELAKALHILLLEQIESSPDFTALLAGFNEHLYKRNETVRLKKGNAVFETKIREVNGFGELVTEDAVERVFKSGEINWV